MTAGSLRGDVDQFIDVLIETADGALHSSKLTTSDTDDLADAKKRIATDARELVELFAENDDIIQRLWSALAAACLIGSRGTVSDSGKLAAIAEKSAKHAAHLRRAKAEKRKSYDEAFMSAIARADGTGRSEKEKLRDINKDLIVHGFGDAEHPPVLSTKTIDRRRKKDGTVL